MTHRNILLATDLSARCDRPFDRALMLAGEWRTQLILLHVAESRQGKAEARDIRDIEAQIARQLPETKADIEILVRTGDVAETIVATASEKQCDLIITGVARYNSLGDIILGGPVDHLLRNASVPLLVVKRRPVQAYQNILVATDFSECSLHGLNAAAELFPDPRLHLVHAYHEAGAVLLGPSQVARDAKSEAQSALARFLAKPAITDTIADRLNGSVEEGDLGAVLVRKIAATNSDLVALGTHGRGALSRTSLGSNAQHVLQWVDEDVLIVRERQ